MFSDNNFDYIRFKKSADYSKDLVIRKGNYHLSIANPPPLTNYMDEIRINNFKKNAPSARVVESIDTLEQARFKKYGPKVDIGLEKLVRDLNKFKISIPKKDDQGNVIHIPRLPPAERSRHTIPGHQYVQAHVTFQDILENGQLMWQFLQNSLHLLGQRGRIPQGINYGVYALLANKKLSVDKLQSIIQDEDEEKTDDSFPTASRRSITSPGDDTQEEEFESPDSMSRLQQGDEDEDDDIINFPGVDTSGVASGITSMVGTISSLFSALGGGSRPAEQTIPQSEDIEPEIDEHEEKEDDPQDPAPPSMNILKNQKAQMEQLKQRQKEEENVVQIDDDEFVMTDQVHQVWQEIIKNGFNELDMNDNEIIQAIRTIEAELVKVIATDGKIRRTGLVVLLKIWEKFRDAEIKTLNDAMFSGQTHMIPSNWFIGQNPINMDTIVILILMIQSDIFNKTNTIASLATAFSNFLSLNQVGSQFDLAEAFRLFATNPSYWENYNITDLIDQQNDPNRDISKTHEFTDFSEAFGHQPVFQPAEPYMDSGNISGIAPQGAYANNMAPPDSDYISPPFSPSKKRQSPSRFSQSPAFYPRQQYISNQSRTGDESQIKTQTQTRVEIGVSSSVQVEEEKDEEKQQEETKPTESDEDDDIAKPKVPQTYKASPTKAISHERPTAINLNHFGLPQINYGERMGAQYIRDTNMTSKQFDQFLKMITDPKYNSNAQNTAMWLRKFRSTMAAYEYIKNNTNISFARSESRKGDKDAWIVKGLSDYQYLPRAGHSIDDIMKQWELSMVQSGTIITAQNYQKLLTPKNKNVPMIWGSSNKLKQIFYLLCNFDTNYGASTFSKIGIKRKSTHRGMQQNADLLYNKLVQGEIQIQKKDAKHWILFKS